MSPSDTDYMSSESEWTSVLPGYRGQWAAAELADYSNDDRAEGDRVLTYCEGTDDSARPSEVATESRREEWRNIMTRVQAEMVEIMAERNAALSPVTSEPCPLSVLADDGCPHHSHSWDTDELVDWTPTMTPEGGVTRCDRPCLAVAANSPVTPSAEIAPLTPANPATFAAAGEWRKVKAGEYQMGSWSIVRAGGQWNVTWCRQYHVMCSTLAKGKEWVSKNGGSNV